MQKVKNIAIFLSIGAVFVLIYIFFIKPSSEDPAALVSSSGVSAVTSTGVANEDSLLAQEFLTLLLGVKDIRLDDSILRDPAFMSLRDSSITLIQDGTEGRPNPFAPL